MTGPAIPPDEKNQWRIVNAIRQLSQGRSDATGIVELVFDGTPFTVVPAVNCAAGSVVILMAATEEAGGTWPIWVSDVVQGQFIIRHSESSAGSNLIANRKFYYVTLG